MCDVRERNSENPRHPGTPCLTIWRIAKRSQRHHLCEGGRPRLPHTPSPRFFVLESGQIQRLCVSHGLAYQKSNLNGMPCQIGEGTICVGVKIHGIIQPRSHPLNATLSSAALPFERSASSALGSSMFPEQSQTLFEATRMTQVPDPGPNPPRERR